MITQNNNEINNLEQLPILREKLCKEIASAAIQGGQSNLFTATERLRSGDALIRQVISLWRADQDQTTPNPAKVPTNQTHAGMSSKAKGEHVRLEWAAAHLGNSVSQLKGALFQNGRGEILGIAYAKESEDRKGRWFLGLPEKRFQTAILLCDPIKGTLNAACLPLPLVTTLRHDDKISKSHGQEKFMVIKREENWFLAVRGQEIPINQNINNIASVI